MRNRGLSPVLDGSRDGIGSKKRLGETPPLGADLLFPDRGLAGATVPVGGVAEVPLDGVEEPVDARPRRRRDSLGDLVGAIPVPGLGVPEGGELRGKAGRRRPAPFDGRAEGFEGHRGKFRVPKRRKQEAFRRREAPGTRMRARKNTPGLVSSLRIVEIRGLSRMAAYFIRRLLLIPPTLVGMTLAVFALIQFTPGGRLEMALMEARMKEGGRSTNLQSSGLTPGQILKLEEQFGHDKPFHIAYLSWLGAVPRETNRSRAEFAPDAAETEVKIPGTAEVVTVKRLADDQAGIVVKEGFDAGSWRARIVTPEEQLRRWRKRNPGQELDAPQPYLAILFQPKFSGLLQGNLGDSTRYSEPVWEMMKRRFPISIFFGVVSLLLTYLVCVPLGVLKAIKHRTVLDNVTSLLIFTGYAIPGFVLGVFLVVVFAARLGWFPLEGFVSADFADLSLWGKVKDLAHHAFLPLVCYMVGSFASLTMLVKNNLMDQLAADYVRTAVAKGLDFKRAVFGHALRNAFIPAAATMGQALTLVVGGSFLIERIFDIDGFGLMGFNALLERDSAIIMGTVTIGGLLLMLGNVLSDLITARLDPRIRFE